MPEHETIEEMLQRLAERQARLRQISKDHEVIHASRFAAVQRLFDALKSAIRGS